MSIEHTTLVAPTWSTNSGAGRCWTPPERMTLTPRYEDLGPLGEGYQAFVRRARDLRLNRLVALKVLWPHLASNMEACVRFFREARVTADLEHPGIVTIFDIGHLSGPDNLPFQALAIVDWRTLRDLMRADGEEGVGVSPARLRQRVELLTRVAEAVAFAHARDIIHRDLKPANIALGQHGEVTVLDWGLAGGDGSTVAPLEAAQAGPALTQLGALRGTPLYMAPEQARRQCASAASDVYSLGAMLYDVAFGRPCPKQPVAKILEQTRQGRLRPMERLEGSSTGFRDICRRCLASEPRDRFVDARPLVDALRAWLAGQDAEVKARGCLDQAAVVDGRLAELEDRRRALQQRELKLLAAVPDWADAARKRPLWDVQDQLREVEEDRAQAIFERDAVLAEALTHAPDLGVVHERLATIAREAHEVAVARGDTPAARAALARLRRHDRAGLHRGYLSGVGLLSVVFDGEPARLTLHRLGELDRRLVEGPGWELTAAELRELRLPEGSWSLRVETDHGLQFTLPLWIRPGEHWAGGHESGELVPVYVPREGEVPAGCRYVPAGSYCSGGDPLAYGDPLAACRQWVDGFAMQTVPVTAGEWVAFLNALVDTGRLEDAERLAPRERAASAGEFGAEILGRTDSGHFFLTHDGDGDLWLDDWPIVFIDLQGVNMYVEWLRVTTGSSWQLPWELQWEKAARGADLRTFPWGDHFDPTFCANARSKRQGVSTPPEVTDHPHDVSPYGVRFLAGGVTEYCRDGYTSSGPDRRGRTWGPPREPARGHVGRGANYTSAAGKCRLCFRTHLHDDVRSPVLGFRLVVPVGPQVARRD